MCRPELACTPGGATPRFWTPTSPPTNCWPEAPWGGGGALEGGFREGRLGGGVLEGLGGGGLREGWLGGGGPGGAIWGVGGGGAQAPLTSPCPPYTIPYHHHKPNPNLCSQLVWPCQPC